MKLLMNNNLLQNCNCVMNRRVLTLQNRKEQIHYSLFVLKVCSGDDLLFFTINCFLSSTLFNLTAIEATDD